MDTEVVGPLVWSILNQISVTADNAFTKKKPIWYSFFLSFLASLGYVFPCGKCRESIGAYLKAFPFNSKREKPVRHYLYEMHSWVNHKLNKCNLPEEKFYKRLETWTRQTSLENIYDWFAIIALNQVQQRCNGKPCPPDVLLTHLGYLNLLCQQWFQVALPAALVAPKTPASMIQALEELTYQNIQKKWAPAIVQEVQEMQEMDPKMLHAPF